MTPLHDILLRQITRLGPLSVSEYMAQCLYHPQHGYYTQAKPLGAGGDFITAPEISQMFGEMVGLCLAQNWLDQGSPAPFCLAELGPGSGQLMADILRATANVPGFHTAANLHLCEVNPHLKSQQAERLAAFNPKWVAATPDLPDMPMFLIANEFFDCLPINQYVKTTTGWDERIIAAQGNRLTFAHRPAVATSELPSDLPAGTTLELCAPANAIAADLARSIATNGGCALIIDYGGTEGTGNTLQAIRNHKKTDPLEYAGQSDLTAHVNFTALAQAAAAIKCTGPVPQGTFLERIGITARAQSLARNMTGGALDTHIAAHRRLTHPDEMGDLFKVIALLPTTAPTPAGFA